MLFHLLDLVLIVLRPLPFFDVALGRFSTFTYPTFLSHLRTCLWHIGINPKLYAGHSFPRGGASFAYEAGYLLT